jgi:hypothetical protein
MVEASTGTPAPAEAKAKTVAENMANRRVFANPEEAAQYLTASAEAFTDFGDTPLAAPGVDAEGNFDPAIYSDSMDVMVSTLKNKGKVKAIVVAPVPKVSVLLESEAGRAWVDRILHKELNHVAVRHLRDADVVTNFVDQMPTTLEGYISSERGTGGIMETYDALYKGIDTALASKLPVWSKARFTKGELKKALESKGYASEFYPAVEDYKGNSLFEAALDIGIAAAKRKGLDPTIFERWKDTRATKTYEPGEEEDEEFDLDALTDALIESGEKADAATAETPAPEAEAETPAEAEAPAA